MQKFSVAIITSTIGRKSLAETIKSVQAQTYPCRHYVFVDGSQYHAAAHEILQHYPDVVAIYLPMNTGEGKWYNSCILAAAPFWVEEEIICYLDDDNRYQPEHVAQIVNVFEIQNPDYVYSLRNFVDRDGAFICQDRTESIGFYRNSLPKNIIQQLSLNGRLLTMQHTITDPFIDVNCYAFPRRLCYQLADIWNIKGFGNDKIVFNFLKDTHRQGLSTGCHSVDYCIEYHNVYSGNLYKMLANYIEDEQQRAQCVKNIVMAINNSTELENAI